MAHKHHILTLFAIFWLLSDNSDAIPSANDPQIEVSYISSDLSVKYSVIGSKIIRPSTIYQLVISLAADTLTPIRVIASVSRNGEAISDNQLKIGPSESSGLLLKIPSDNSGQTADYILRIEGHRATRGGGIVFQKQEKLVFLREFLSITISTSRVIYDATGTIKIRFGSQTSLAAMLLLLFIRLARWRHREILSPLITKQNNSPIFWI